MNVSALYTLYTVHYNECFCTTLYVRWIPLHHPVRGMTKLFLSVLAGEEQGLISAARETRIRNYNFPSPTPPSYSILLTLPYSPTPPSYSIPLTLPSSPTPPSYSIPFTHPSSPPPPSYSIPLTSPSSPPPTSYSIPLIPPSSSSPPSLLPIFSFSFSLSTLPPPANASSKNYSDATIPLVLLINF